MPTMVAGGVHLILAADGNRAFARLPPLNSSAVRRHSDLPRSPSAMHRSDLIHPATGKLNVARLHAEAARLRNELLDSQSKMGVDYPHLRLGFDARLTCFARLINVLGSFYLGSSFWLNSLLSAKWWQSSTNCPVSDRQLLRNEFQQFLKLGLVHFSFSSVESSLRVFLRAIDPAAQSGAAAEFKRVYDDLLLRRLSAAKPTAVELLDMAARIRNTVHNNGVYFHKSGLDVTQHYKGRSYDFRHGKPVEFAGWPLLLEITSDLGSVVADIARDPSIVGIGGEILDPSS